MGADSLLLDSGITKATTTSWSSHCPRVSAPTLLIVGGDDRQVLELNRRAQTTMTAVNRLEIVPGATHLFEEQGALEEVIRLAQAWFCLNLKAA